MRRQLFCDAAAQSLRSGWLHRVSRPDEAGGRQPGGAVGPGRHHVSDAGGRVPHHRRGAGGGAGRRRADYHAGHRAVAPIPLEHHGGEPHLASLRDSLSVHPALSLTRARAATGPPPAHPPARPPLRRPQVKGGQLATLEWVDVALDVGTSPLEEVEGGYAADATAAVADGYVLSTSLASPKPEQISITGINGTSATAVEVSTQASAPLPPHPLPPRVAPRQASDSARLGGGGACCAASGSQGGEPTLRQRAPCRPRGCRAARWRS